MSEHIIPFWITAPTAWVFGVILFGIGVKALCYLLIAGWNSFVFDEVGTAVLGLGGALSMAVGYLMERRRV